MEERAKLGMKPDEHLSVKNKDQKKLCEELKVKNGPAIQEGMTAWIRPSSFVRITTTPWLT